MKEEIRAKLEDHIKKILAKDEITNEDYYLLLMVYQKIESEEKLAEIEERNRRDREEDRNRTLGAFCSIFGLKPDENGKEQES